MTAIKQRSNKIYQWLSGEVSIAPLAVFRIAFGVMMFAALVRFASKGWINSLFIEPKFFFSYYGFDWIKPLAGNGMYIVFAVMMLAALMIATGLFYRIAAITFFVLFTYVELIDKSNYLNHYYFISIMAGLLCLLPANKKYSFDVWLGITRGSTVVPRWAITALQLQMAMVYFFAGIAKINADWLLHAMPLKIWLPAKYDTPLIGSLLTEPIVAYLFSWCGMLFDVSVAFLLFNRRTVWWAYAAVIVFHVLTAILFPGIGMFPFIMIVCAAVFLPATFHQKLLSILPAGQTIVGLTNTRYTFNFQKPLLAILVLHFAVQTFMPFRYLLYPGNLFYTEEGYRFSWRVMLMEKTGYTVFHVKDAATGKSIEVNNKKYLTAQQERQMSTQPDMLVQFAHFLENEYAETFDNPQVYVEAYVAMNGRSSRLFINPDVNLANESAGLTHQKWIIAAAH